MNEQHPSDEWIRQHGGFVRSLSRSILRGEDRDDAVQEAWLAALRRPPERHPAAWLRSVTTRLAGRFQREGARRTRRERAVARPEALPSTASLVEKAEILRLVGEVVTSLREPYREALLLRYYEEQPPREIAAQLGVPVATVQSRIQRGLRLAREELEARSRGHARPWTETLAVAVGLDPRSLVPASGSLVTLGVVGMKTKTWLIVGGVVLAAVSALGIREWQRTPARGDVAAAAEEPVEPAESAEAAPAQGLADVVEREPLVPLRAEGPAVEPAARRLGGGVLDPLGRRVGGAEILVGPDARRLRSLAVADAAGAFFLDVGPQDRVACARAAGWGPSPLVRLPAEDEARPLVLRLPVRGARLEVSVVDEAANPIAGAIVFAGRDEERDHRSPDGTLARTVPGFEQATDGLGLARFEGLAVGWIRITVTHPEFAPTTVFATLQPGERNAVDVRLEGGFFVEGVVRDEAGQPVAGAALTRGSSQVRTETSDADGFFRFGPIDSGKVVVTGPRGRRTEARLAGEAGETVPWSPILRSDATLRGVVLDPEGRARAELWVTANRDTWPGWSRGTTTDERGRFEIHACPEGALRLEVREAFATDFPALVLEGVEAGPEELRIVLPDVEPVTVRGSVAAPGGVLPELRLQHLTTPVRQRLTGGDGARLELHDEVFELEGVPPGRYRLVALGAPYGWTKLAELEVRDEDVDLGHFELPLPGTLATTFVRPAGAPSAVARFLLENRAQFATLLDIEGEFPATLELAPGKYVLQVEVTPGPQAEYTFEIQSGETTRLEVDLGSTCVHRVLVRYRSGRRPSGAAELTVRQLDVERIVADGAVTQLEEDSWVREVALEPGRFEFLVRTPDGSEARAVHNLFTSRPGRVIELVVGDE